MLYLPLPPIIIGGLYLVINTTYLQFWRYLFIEDFENSSLTSSRVIHTCHISVKTFFTKEKDSVMKLCGHKFLLHWHSGRLHNNTTNLKPQINSRCGYFWCFFVKCQKSAAVRVQMLFTIIYIFPSDRLARLYIVMHKQSQWTIRQQTKASRRSYSSPATNNKFNHSPSPCYVNLEAVRGRLFLTLNNGCLKRNPKATKQIV